MRQKYMDVHKEPALSQVATLLVTSKGNSPGGNNHLSFFTL